MNIRISSLVGLISMLWCLTNLVTLSAGVPLVENSPKVGGDLWESLTPFRPGIQASSDNSVMIEMYVGITKKPNSIRGRVRVGDETPIRAKVLSSMHPELKYKWQTSGGRIIGEGPEVILDASKSKRGDYVITVRVERNNGSLIGYTRMPFSIAPEPVLPNQPPTVSLEIGPITYDATDRQRQSAQTVCVGDKVALRASASDPDGDTLSYSWSTTGGRIVGDGPYVSFDTTNLKPGDYTITVQVDDGCGCEPNDNGVRYHNWQTSTGRTISERFIVKVEKAPSRVAFDSKTIRVNYCPPKR